MTNTFRGWSGVLNQLAGTKNLGMVTAANIYAGTADAQGHPTLAVVGALNVKAGNGTDPSKWVGLNLVCNQIAGTTGLEALQALNCKAGNKNDTGTC